MGGIFAPLVLCGGVLAYHPQLAVQNANAPSYRDHLAGGGIISGRQKGGFAAGHLQTAALHILHPCRGLAPASRELHRRFHRLPALGQLHRELPRTFSSGPQAHGTSRRPVRCSSCCRPMRARILRPFCGCAAAGCRSASSSGAAPPRSGSARAAGW